METRRARTRKSEAESLSTKTPSKTPRAETRSTKMANKRKPLSNDAFIMIGVAAAVLFMGVSIFGYQKFYNQYVKIPRFSSMADRYSFFMQWNFMVHLPMLLSMFQVMNGRVGSKAVDPLSGNEDVVQRAKNILTNNLEQTVLYLINGLVLVSWIPVEQMYLVPLMAVLFVFGRIAFMAGYTIDSRFRTFGFIVTFVPTLYFFASSLLFGFGLRNQIAFFHANTNTAAPRASN